MYKITLINISEEKFDETKEIYNIITSQVLMGLIIIQSGRIKYNNEAAEKILEYSHMEIISWDLTDIRNLIFTDDLASVLKDSKTSLTQSENGSNPLRKIQLSFRIITKSGKVKWINLSSNRIIYRDKPADVMTFSDITEQKIPEELLKIKDDRIRILSEQALMVVAIIQDGKVKHANEAFSKLCEYSIEEIKSWEKYKLFQLIHPDDREIVINQEKKKQLGFIESSVPHYCHRMITKSGKTKWVENYSKSIIFEGKPADFVMSIDVTEQKKVEQELRESEEMFKLMGEQSLIGIIIAQEGKVQYLNNTLADLIGYSREEIKKWNLQNLFKIIHPSDVRLVLEQARKKQVGNTDNIVPHYSFRLITRSGEIKWVENYSKTVTFHGKPAIFGTWIDITDFKKSEEDLRKSLKRHRLLSENAKDLIFSLNMELQITFISETVKHNLGYEPDELLNQHISKIFTKKSMIITNNAFNEELEEEKNKEFIEDHIRRIFVEFIHKDGSIISSETTTTFSRDDDGNINGILGVARNISERKKILKELKTVNSGFNIR